MKAVYYDALLELSSYNPKLLAANENLVEYLREQKDDQALELLVPFVEGLKWVLEVISHTNSILSEYGLGVDFENYTMILKEMMEALENQDYVLLGDLLEYEIYPFLENIQTTVEKVDWGKFQVNNR